MTKDSQDWLVVVTGLYADYYANKITLGELSDGVNSIVREHFLKEALEILNNSDRGLPFSDKYPQTLAEYTEAAVKIREVLRQELRNKFNDKYKED